jgi:hypothetical protein
MEWTIGGPYPDTLPYPALCIGCPPSACPLRESWAAETDGLMDEFELTGRVVEAPGQQSMADAASCMPVLSVLACNDTNLLFWTEDGMHSMS